MAYYRRRRRGYNRYRGGGRRRYYRRSGGQFRAAAQQRDAARVVLKYDYQFTVDTAGTAPFRGAHAFNLWTGLAVTPFYDLYAQMYDQLKINGIRIKIGLKGLADQPGFPTQGVYTQIAFDRNGICQPTANMTYEKIATYSSAKGTMLTAGTNRYQSASIYPTTMGEKEQYVATAIIPNIANSLVDDNIDETSTAAYQFWAFKPILLFGVESNAADSVVFRASIQYDVSFRGMRYDPNAIE